MSARPTSLKIAIADDHSLVRSGLVALLEDIPDVEVAAEFDDGDALLEQLDSLDVDLVITDISMQRTSGLLALREIKARRPDLKVLMLSMYDSAEFVHQAVASGANGYLLKDFATVELQLALQAVSAGHVYLSPRVSSRLVERFQGPRAETRDTPGAAGVAEPQPVAASAASSGSNPAAGASADPGVTSVLTPRQIEILTLVARGKALKEIAYELGLSVKTVETHRSMLMDRLGIRDLPTLVRYAVRQGLVPLDAPDRR